MRNRKTSSAWRLGGLTALVLLSSCVTTGRAVAQPSIGVSVEAFDSTLSPYGEWVMVGGLGRVWRPYPAVVGVDFRPYLSGGHWVYTDYGWSFESDYEWGWAPFHYGRWYLADYYGWVWVPDTVWGPAWVDWRFGNGYVGWVPLAPFGFSINTGFYRPWCFVPVQQFVVRDVYHYAVPVERFHWAYSVTTPIQQPVRYAGVQWNAGPPPGQVSQAIGQPIHAASIAPPVPGRVQPVRIASPAGVPAHGVSAAPSSPGSVPPGYAPHSSTAPAPGYVAPAPHPAPPSSASNGRWGSPPVGSSAPSSAPHSAGGSVAPSAPAAGAGHSVSPAPSAAPGPMPSTIHPSAPPPRPAPSREDDARSPGGKQGFYSPRMNQGAPQRWPAPAGGNVGRSFGAVNRPLAYRSAPPPRPSPPHR
jgi:hypothetical protein